MSIISQETFEKFTEVEKRGVRELNKELSTIRNENGDKYHYLTGSLDNLDALFGKENLQEDLIIPNFNVGDTVKIKDRDWYDKNKNSEGDVISTIPIFDKYNARYCGTVAKITGIEKTEWAKYRYTIIYRLDIDNGRSGWPEQSLDGDYNKTKEDQDKNWNALDENGKKNIQYLYNNHPELKVVADALRTRFGEHNIQLKPQIKTWKDVEKAEGGDIKVNSKVTNPNGRAWGLSLKYHNKAEASLKLAILIDLGYGGMVKEEEWGNDEWKYVISCGNNELLKEKTCHRKEFIAFHTQQQRDEFMSYPENITLIKQYYIIKE